MGALLRTSEFIQCLPDESAAAWLLAQTEALRRIKTQRMADAERDYQSYRLSRSNLVRPETLADFYGAAPAAEMEARYRAEMGAK